MCSNTVYVVSRWEAHEGSHIKGIFRDREKASSYCEELQSQIPTSEWELSGYEMVEYEVC